VIIKIWCLYNPEILFANSIIIEGDDGVVVVDTGVSKDAGKYIKAILNRNIKIIGRKKKLQEFFNYLDRDLEPINLTVR
jgi:hypothetical protein